MSASLDKIATFHVFFRGKWWVFPWLFVLPLHLSEPHSKQWGSCGLQVSGCLEGRIVQESRGCLCTLSCGLAGGISSLLKVGQGGPQVLALPQGSPLQSSEEGQYHLPQQFPQARRAGTLS